MCNIVTLTLFISNIVLIFNEKQLFLIFITLSVYISIYIYNFFLYILHIYNGSGPNKHNDSACYIL